MKRTLITLLALTLTGVASVHAVPIAYTGSQLNVDPKTTSLPTTPDSFGWRNATPVKPLDVDGDNVIGTDGYWGRASNVAPNVIPSYLSFNAIVTGGNPFGYFDNPLDPTGIDTARIGFQGTGSVTADLFSVTITVPDLVKQTLGVVVQFDTYGSGTQTYFLEQRDGGVGGSVLASATSGVITNANDGYDWAFFEITGPNNGDVFVLKAVKGTTSVTYGQVAFDTEPIPPSGTVIIIR